VDVDAGTTISALWGTFDPGIGGIIGGKWGTATVYMKGCDVACELDVFNDVTSAYRWYSYRRCGMLIGNSEETKTVNGRTEATASYLKTVDCTVSYGDWTHYHYCEFSKENYPYVRVEKGLFNDAFANARYGLPSGQDGEKLTAEQLALTEEKDEQGKPLHNEFTHEADEDHYIEIVFNQLYGGGQGCYGGNWHADEKNPEKGVTIYANGEVPTTVRKFEDKKYAEQINNGDTIKLGDLFEATGNGDIKNFDVYIFVSNTDADHKVTAEYTKNNDDWTQSTLKFTGDGPARITISDYYFCHPTTIYLEIGPKQSVEKFEVAFDHDPNTAGKQNHVNEYLYRVGNNGTVALGTLFDTGENAQIGENVVVSFELLRVMLLVHTPVILLGRMVPFSSAAPALSR
jgi:hypothetical protein